MTTRTPTPSPAAIWRLRPPPRALWVWGAAGALACILLGSLREIVRLSAGGESIAELAGGRLVPSASREPLDRRGILRWDPQMKERRSGKDRRDGFSGAARDR